MKVSVCDDDRRIILASGSPRRRELLEQLGFEPLVRVSSVPEARAPGEAPQQYTERLAREKATAVVVALRDDATRTATPDWVLAADTIVTLGGEVLEKPSDAAHAAQMLRALSGREHEVITSFCWMSRSGAGSTVRSVVARVRFLELDEATIARYVATGEPMDKAGAYGIQGVAGALIEGMTGSYTAVVGLPVAEVVQALAALGGLSGFPFAPRAAAEALS